MASKESHLPVGVESHCDERSIKIVGLERNPAFKLRPLACKNPPPSSPPSPARGEGVLELMDFELRIALH